MDERTWDGAILTLFEFFRVEKLPTKQQQALWFKSVKHIHNSEVKEIIEQITRDCDSLPRNIPKAFAEHRPQASGLRMVQYDPNEDFRFPVSKLHDALKILEEKDDAAFYAYANAVGMPKNDRDRVKYKHQIILGNVTVKPLIYKEAQDTIPF